MKNLLNALLRVTACLCLVSSTVANDRILEENKESVESFDLAELAEMNSISGLERIGAIHSYFARLSDQDLPRVLECLVEVDRGRAESDLLRMVLLKLSLFGDFELVEEAINRLDEGIVDQCWYRLGWEMADVDPDKGVDFLLWLEESSSSESEFAEGLLYSLKQYNVMKLIENFDRFSYYDEAIEAMEEYVVALSKEDLAAAWEMLERYEEDLNWANVLEGILDGLVERDMEQALAFSLGLEDSYAREVCLSRILRTMAGSDGSKAVALLESLCAEHALELEGLRNDLAGELVSAWFLKEPSSCLDWILSHETRGVRRDLLSELRFWSLGPESFSRIAETVLGDARFPQDVNMKNRFFENWIDGDVTSFVQWASRTGNTEWLKGVGRYRLLNMVRTVPEFVENLVEELPKGEERSKLSEAVASSWDKSDMAGFLDWVGSVDDEDSMENAMYSFFNTRSLSDDLGLEAEFVQSLPEGRVQDMYRKRLVDRFSNVDLDRVSGIVLEITDASLRANALGQMARTLVDRDPEAALKIGQENDTLRHTNFMQAMLSKIAENEPEKAYQHLGSLTDTNQIRSVASKVFGNIFDRDEEYAIELLESEPIAASRDGGWKALSDRVVNSDPEEALVYATKVEDSELRRAQMLSSYTVFINRYPEKAEGWLEEAPIAGEEFEELLKIRAKVDCDESEETFFLKPFHVDTYSTSGVRSGVW